MYEYNAPRNNRMLVEAVELACARLRGVVGEYGNKADKKILEDLCAQARESKHEQQTEQKVELNAETLKKMAEALKKTKAALEKLHRRQQPEA